MAERRNRHFPAGWACAVLLWLALAAAQPAAAALVSQPFETFDCTPFGLPPPDAFLSGPRRVYAHYFSRFPQSIDNRPGNDDYYQTQYLSPLGEHNKWLDHGGYLRSRPVAVAPSTLAGFHLANMQHEVRMALSRGIGGFTFDILGLDDLKPGSYLDLMLQAAQAVDPRFQIVLMLDAASLGKDTAVHEQAIELAEQYSGLARTPDGRLIVSVFAAEAIPAGDWAKLLDRLAGRGRRIAFYPTFLTLGAAEAKAYGPYAVGLGTFATPLEGEADRIHAAAQATRAAGVSLMAGIPTQGYRPKDWLFWESHGGSAFRKSWAAAIAEGADAVQLTTWNDFSESTQLTPYTDGAGAPGTGFFDLNAYFATWFVTGQAPVIARDAVYYFFRRQPVAELGQNDHVAIHNAVPSVPATDAVDLVLLLKASGDVEIATGSVVTRRHVDAGLTTLALPLVVGKVSVTLRRGGKATRIDAPVEVMHAAQLPTGYADLTYWSGGGAFPGQCTAEQP